MKKKKYKAKAVEVSVARLKNYQPALRIKELIANMVIVANVPTAHLILQFKGEVV